VTGAYEIVTQNWQWFDDENSLTPSSALAGENISPINVSNGNTIKLRITVAEMSGVSGNNVKMRLQYSNFSDFSANVYDVNPIWDCELDSEWCFADGAGNDNATITAKVLSDSDACVGGVGDGCGSHNEAGTTTSNIYHKARANAEFEYTIKHSGARANAVYFFRLYDHVNDEVVLASTTATYPSLTTEGALLTFSISGIDASTLTEGTTTDVSTTATSVPFGTLTINHGKIAAQRLTVSTNATEGYQIFVFQRQGLTSGSGEIDPVTGTNPSPGAWTSVCDSGAESCYGYHAGDDSLFGGSARFAPDDTFARFDSSPYEIVYNPYSVTNEITDVVFKVLARDAEDPGDYQSGVVYVVVPVF
jgi:hypothetical protein